MIRYRDTQSSYIRFVVFLHRHSMRQTTSSRPINGSGGAGWEDTCTVDTGHDNGSQKSLSLAEKQNGLCHFRRLLWEYKRHLISSIIHINYKSTYCISQNIAGPLDLQHCHLLFVQITKEFLYHGCIWTQHAGDQKYVQFAAF